MEKIKEVGANIVEWKFNLEIKLLLSDLENLITI